MAVGAQITLGGRRFVNSNPWVLVGTLALVMSYTQPTTIDTVECLLITQFPRFTFGLQGGPLNQDTYPRKVARPSPAWGHLSKPVAEAGSRYGAESICQRPTHSWGQADGVTSETLAPPGRPMSCP